MALADRDLPNCGLQEMGPRELSRQTAQECPQYQDYRQMLDKEKLDGVIVATPTHVRVLVCLHAMQAGLDVNAEKPLTLTIEEGQYLIRAERSTAGVRPARSGGRYPLITLAATWSGMGRLARSTRCYVRTSSGQRSGQTCLRKRLRLR